MLSRKIFENLHAVMAICNAFSIILRQILFKFFDSDSVVVRRPVCPRRYLKLILNILTDYHILASGYFGVMLAIAVC